MANTAHNSGRGGADNSGRGGADNAARARLSMTEADDTLGGITMKTIQTIIIAFALAMSLGAPTNAMFQHRYPCNIDHDNDPDTPNIDTTCGGSTSQTFYDPTQVPAKSGGGSSAGAAIGIPVVIGGGLWLLNLTPIGIAPLPFEFRVDKGENSKAQIFSGTTYKTTDYGVFSFGVKQTPKDDDVAIGIDWRYTLGK